MVAASPKFSLADIRKVMAGKNVKKEKPVLLLPKAPVPIQVSGSASKKRKPVEILDLTMTDSEPMEVMKKLSVMTEAV
jgi:hypothetical protein